MNMNVEIGDRGAAAAAAPVVQSPIVSIVNVCKTYPRGDLVALTDVNCHVHRGEFIVILGPSGAGKSTLLRCINRLVLPSTGQIYVNGREMNDARRDLRRARREIGMVFQQFNLVPRLSVLM